MVVLEGLNVTTDDENGCSIPRCQNIHNCIKKVPIFVSSTYLIPSSYPRDGDPVTSGGGASLPGMDVLGVINATEDNGNEIQLPRNAAQPTGGVAPLDTLAGSVTPPFAPPETAIVVDTLPDVPGDSTASSADKSSPPLHKVNKANGKQQQKDKDSARITSSFASSSSQQYANDHVSWATQDSQTGDQLKQKYGKAARICTLMLSENAQPNNMLSGLHPRLRMKPALYGRFHA
ncbi:hypothetical protein BKA82DRAFT_4011271 [Pisolithus tinctorius]|nr:hypothetical protein BKA82DRAFT_4011271 [Pisolithus tinctorius]